MESERVRWMVVIHLTFVVSGVLLAAMDWIASRAKPHRARLSVRNPPEPKMPLCTNAAQS
jgi:hypothetical protein